jgi:hypothetical protein
MSDRDTKKYQANKEKFFFFLFFSPIFVAAANNFSGLLCSPGNNCTRVPETHESQSKYARDAERKKKRKRKREKKKKKSKREQKNHTPSTTFPAVPVCE